MRFKNYDDFLNEDFIDRAKAFIKKVGEFFKGTGSKFLNAILFQSKKELPRGVTFYPSAEDIRILKTNGVTIIAPKLQIKELSTTVKPVEEAKIDTKFPDAGRVVDVDAEQLREAIRDCVEGGKNSKPLLVWGAPGIGKTAIINAIAVEYFGQDAKEKKRMIDFDLMTMSPEDFFMPSVSNKDDVNKARGTRLPDEWLPVRRIDDVDAEKDINGPDGAGGILFFDEIARCSTKVQGVCLKLIDERRVGNYILGEKWVIICAANRKSDLSDDEQEAFHWSSTLANRFQQVNFASTIEDWSPWAMSAKDDFGELLVQPEIVAFLKFNQSYFHMLDPEDFSNSASGSEAWPSPRTWTNAAQAITVRKKRLEKNGWKDKEGKTVSEDRWMSYQELILKQNVGSDAASAFVGFQRLMKKINPEDIKLVFTDAKSPKCPVWKKEKKSLPIDQVYALISAACFQMKDVEQLTKEQLSNFTTWVIKNEDAPNAIKAINLLKEVVPTMVNDDYFNDECKNRFVDAFPHIFDGERQK